jgi:hypothetical protein
MPPDSSNIDRRENSGGAARVKKGGDEKKAMVGRWELYNRSRHLYLIGGAVAPFLAIETGTDLARPR